MGVNMCDSGDTRLSIVRLSEIKFKANVLSYFHAFARRKGALEVDPDAISRVAVSLVDGSTIYAVAGASEGKKLISMQKRIDEEKEIVSLMQNRDEIAAA